MTYAQVISTLKTDSNFRKILTKILQDSLFRAYFWEVKPITTSDLNTIFEFVLVESKRLADIQADKSHFKSYFIDNQTVVTFPNLGHDAQLVVPTPIISDYHYNHLATFVRNAPAAQVDAFWQTVGEEYEKKLGSEPKWLSTSGLGVYWLHVRVDSYPKYYTHVPYRSHRKGV